LAPPPSPEYCHTRHGAICGGERSAEEFLNPDNLQPTGAPHQLQVIRTSRDRKIICVGTASRHVSSNGLRPSRGVSDAARKEYTRATPAKLRQKRRCSGSEHRISRREAPLPNLSRSPRARMDVLFHVILAISSLATCLVADKISASVRPSHNRDMRVWK